MARTITTQNTRDEITRSVAPRVAFDCRPHTERCLGRLETPARRPHVGPRLWRLARRSFSHSDSRSTDPRCAIVNPSLRQLIPESRSLAAKQSLAGGGAFRAQAAKRERDYGPLLRNRTPGSSVRGSRPHAATATMRVNMRHIANWRKRYPCGNSPGCQSRSSLAWGLFFQHRKCSSETDSVAES